MDNYPLLLIAKTIQNAKTNLKIEKNSLPAGLKKELIEFLLSDANDKHQCICGNVLGDKEVELLKSYLEILPPYSYTQTYNEFVRTAKNYMYNYDISNLEEIIKRALDNQEYAERCDIDIGSIDDEEKRSKDVEELVIERSEAESKRKGLEERIRIQSMTYQQRQL